MQTPLILRMVVLVTLSVWHVSCSPGREFVTIGTGPIGGAYYAVGVGMAEMIQRYIPEVTVRVEVTGGALENPALIEAGQVQMAFTNSHIAHFAQQGMRPFDRPFQKMYALAGGLAPGISQYVVRGDSGLSSISQLSGLRVAAGAQGSTATLVLQEALGFHGLSLGELSMSYVSYSEGVRALLDRKVDMAVVQSAAPSPAIAEAIAGGHRIRLLEWSPSERTRFLSAHDYHSPLDLDPSVYDGYFENPLHLVSTQNMLVVDPDVDTRLVRQILSVIFEHLDEFHAIHPSARWVTPQRAVQTLLPLHPGAAQYFNEKGILKNGGP